MQWRFIIIHDDSSVYGTSIEAVAREFADVAIVVDTRLGEELVGGRNPNIPIAEQFVDEG